MSADPVSSPKSLWGGRAGRLLPADEQVVGARVVTPEGRHGFVLERPYHAVHYGRPGHRIPMDAGFTKVRYQSGADELRLATELYEEIVPAPLERALHDPPAWRLDGRVREGERMTVEALLAELIAAGERARHLPPEAAAALRERMRLPLSQVHTLQQKLFDTPIRARLSAFEIRRLQLEVFGAHGDVPAEQQLAQMASLPPDWRTRWRVGQIVRGPESEAHPARDGWTIERIVGDEALIVGYGRERWVPLWRLEPDYTAGDYPLPTQPVSLYTLARELYARYTGRSPALALEASRAEERATRQALPLALTAWLREQGVPLKVARKAGLLHIAPPRWPLSTDEQSRLDRLLPGLKWDEDGAFVVEVMVAPEHIGRVSALVAHALRDAGLHLSALGEARRVQNASACQPVIFELKGHGQIRVDCGDPSNPEAWHSLYVADVRYAWGGRGWMNRKLPPLAVLEAVRERGIRVFG